MRPWISLVAAALLVVPTWSALGPANAEPPPQRSTTAGGWNWIVELDDASGLGQGSGAVATFLALTGSYPLGYTMTVRYAGGNMVEWRLQANRYVNTEVVAAFEVVCPIDGPARLHAGAGGPMLREGICRTAYHESTGVEWFVDAEVEFPVTVDLPGGGGAGLATNALDGAGAFRGVL